MLYFAVVCYDVRSSVLRYLLPWYAVIGKAKRLVFTVCFDVLTQLYALLCSTLLCSALLRSALLSCSMLCYTTLCCALLGHATLCYGTVVVIAM